MTKLSMAMFLTKKDLEEARKSEKLGPDFPFDNTKMAEIMDVFDGPEQECRPLTAEELEDHPNTCRCEVCRFWGA